MRIWSRNLHPQRTSQVLNLVLVKQLTAVAALEWLLLPITCFVKPAKLNSNKPMLKATPTQLQKYLTIF